MILQRFRHPAINQHEELALLLRWVYRMVKNLVSRGRQSHHASV